MRRMKLCQLSGAILMLAPCVNLAWAEESVDPLFGIIQTQDQNPRIIPKKILSTDENFKSESIVSEKISLEKTSDWRTSAEAGIGVANYSVSGSGFTSKVPLRAVYSVGGGIKRVVKSGIVSAFGIEILHQEAKVSGYSNVTPSSIAIAENKVSIYSLLPPFGREYPINFKVGYFYYRRDAGKTVPNEIVSSPIAHGVILGARALLPLSFKSTVLLGSEFFVPVDYKESGGSTGSHRRSIWLSSHLGYRYQFSGTLFVGLKAISNFKRSTFSGTGGRGTVEAVEKDISFIFPLEIGVVF